MIRYCVLAILLFGVTVLAQDSPITSSETKPPEETNPAPTLPDSTTLERIKTVNAVYPYEAVKDRMQGQVRIKILITEQGDVESAEVVEGDEVFRQSALESVKKWKYKPYIRNGKPVRVSTTVNVDFVFSGKVENFKYVPPKQDADDKTSGPNGPKRVRVSQGVSEGMLIHKVQPMYPPAARMNHVQGRVVLHAIIGRDGVIRDLQVVSGPKELQQSAMGAVRQWRYRPYYLFGQPVEIDTEITVNYVLQ